LDAWLRFFALSLARGKNPPGVGKMLRLAADRLPATRAKYLTKHY
jgi:hypothetical protein